MRVQNIEELKYERKDPANKLFDHLTVSSY